ncbi:type II restriction enzyme [Helicobacter sp. T3_23-1059]
MQSRTNKKHAVLLDLYNHCEAQNDFVFHNDLVKDYAKKHNFGNPFDATKLDSSEKLPRFFRENDICLLHLGSGNHKFIKGIDKLYHAFEPIQENITWDYQKGLLDEFNDSESNVLSMANNYHILHHFLFFDEYEPKKYFKIVEKSINNYYNSINNKTSINHINVIVDTNDKWHIEYHIFCDGTRTYFPHRTNTDLEYYFDNEKIVAKNQQIEIDLTLEYNGTIGIFEAKNGEPKDFNVYQIYHPFLYYTNANLPIKEIICCYLTRNENSLKLWAYTFENPLQLDSIKFIKSREYILKSHKYIPKRG